ncbi:MAG: signal peptidase I [Defluviitaleaceae bacterium]|nr:signal peptidase I [Defluviitaleaceae bacterium]
MEQDNTKDITKSNITRNQKIRKEIFSWVRVLLFAAVAALIINNIIIVNASVPTGSMQNTIAANSRLVAFRLSYLFSEPQRFDVVVFRYPDNEAELHVKRIIGLPGDTIDIMDGLVFINGDTVPLDEWYLPEPAHGPQQHFEVPQDNFFVMGDNRNHSLDGRGLGGQGWQTTSYLPRENILGRAIFTYFPSIGLIR